MKRLSSHAIHLNLTTKLILVFVAFAVLLLAVVSLLAYNSGRAALESAAGAELVSTAIQKQAALDTWISEAKTHAVALSASPYLQRNVAGLLAANASGNRIEALDAHDRIAAELQIWRGEGRDFLEWILMDANSGQIITATEASLEGKFREDQPFFSNGKRDPFVQNVYFSPSLQRTLVTVSAPILSTKGELLGVLAGDLDLGKMNAIISQRTGLHQSDEAYLVNTSEMFVTQPRFISDPAVLQRGVYTVAIKNCLTPSSGVINANDYRGIPSLIVYRWLPEHQLCLIIKMEYAEALAPVYNLGNSILLVSGLALLAALALANWLARTITRPLQHLVRGVREIGAGNLNTRIELRSGDEIGQLAGAFNQMADNLAKTLVSRDDLLKEISERKRTEMELERSNKELVQFAYIASHDLQEPLRMVSSYTQLLAQRYEGQLDDKARKYIHYAVDGAMRMQRLINDLLIYSRVSTQGKTPEAVDLRIVLGEALRDLSVAIEESQAVITVDDLPVVHADPTQLLQLFQNLISNAIKFRGSDAPHITISGRDLGSEWQFAVADNGIGIDAKYAGRLFVIFQRLHTRQEYPGTGIGLAVCKRIVERHRGKIWFESEPGKGSTFYFTLPKGKETIQ